MLFCDAILIVRLCNTKLNEGMIMCGELEGIGKEAILAYFMPAFTFND
jgi:hypothetical protein